jgi:hypothetical protein
VARSPLVYIAWCRRGVSHPWYQLTLGAFAECWGRARAWLNQRPEQAAALQVCVLRLGKLPPGRSDLGPLPNDYEPRRQSVRIYERLFHVRRRMKELL